MPICFQREASAHIIESAEGTNRLYYTYTGRGRNRNAPSGLSLVPSVNYRYRRHLQVIKRTKSSSVRKCYKLTQDWAKRG